MNAAALYRALRKAAQAVTGCTVYKPRHGAALFVCSHSPLPSNEDWDITNEDGRSYLTPTGSFLLRMGAKKQAQDKLPLLKLNDDEDRILYTCSCRLSRADTVAPVTELYLPVLLHLAFQEKTQLSRSLPGLMACRLRQKQELCPYTARLILESLNTASACAEEKMPARNLYTHP